MNTASSCLIDTDALYDALVNRRIAGAGLDVHDQEPLRTDSPWRSLDNVTITTHYAGDTTTTTPRPARLGTAAVNARELGWV
ncbi:NAD(P)-dependent oxidoreductase [Streptomyces sp. NPDC054841]